MLYMVMKHNISVQPCLYSPNNRRASMKRFIASVVLAIALLTSGVVATQYNMVGTAYADGGE